jgi:ferredoxin
MPARRTEQGREEFEHTLGEGVRFLPQRSVARFEGSGGRVERVRLIGVKRTYDEAGRFAPVFDETIEEVREADLVILAIGQRPDLGFLSEKDGVRLTKTGTVEVERETLATSAPGIFAGGDVAFGPRNLIDAEADGKRAARSIHALLAGASSRAPSTRLRFEKIPTARYWRRADYDLLPRRPPPAVELGRRTGIGEVEQCYDEAQAREQAERCLACHVQTIFDAQRCVLCNRCVDVCPEGCLKLVPIEQLQLSDEALTAARRGGGVENGQRASAMLKDDERCIRCGLCAIRCPVDAMTMEVLHYEQR